MKWIGLTGGIACGKTTVANYLRELEIPVVDADRLAHQALKKNQDRIMAYFGPEIVGADGNIDRKSLGNKVFASEKLRSTLEGIIHPYVRDKVKEKRRLFEIAGHALAVYDVPLLFEKSLQDEFDHTLVVYLPVDVSIQRLMDRNGLTAEQAELRIKNQMDIEKKKELADTVFDNRGDRESLKAQVIAWKNSIMESSSQE